MTFKSGYSFPLLLLCLRGWQRKLVALANSAIYGSFPFSAQEKLSENVLSHSENSKEEIIFFRTFVDRGGKNPPIILEKNELSFPWQWQYWQNDNVAL